ILQVDRLEHTEWHVAEVFIAALEGEVGRGREEVQVLRAWEVRKENEDHPQGTPPTYVPADHPTVTATDGARQRRCEGLEGIGMTVGGKEEALGSQPEANVEEDEDAYDQAVTPNRTCLDPLVQVCARVVPQFARLHQEAPHEEEDHADQDQHGKQVGEQPVGVAHDAEVEPTGERPWQEAV